MTWDRCWEGSDGGTATRVGQMLLFLAFVKRSKTLFPNTWHRPLILWVWGRMKESEGRRKEAGEINREKTLLGVVWICFMPCCLDCFLFLHTAATKLRIPIGRHRSARQQHRNKHFLTGLHGKNALVHSATGGKADSGKYRENMGHFCCFSVNENIHLWQQYTRLINQSPYYVWKCCCTARNWMCYGFSTQSEFLLCCHCRCQHPFNSRTGTNGRVQIW